ncbi:MULTISPECIES: hypothetical protein [Haloarcula]|uniref:hypothetical protein n=1 Tax=Haloarcula TaxID=2237 RepID=UPI0023EBCB3D|nr:hypothetical protein [Halomicroarcula sp. XH51]
MPQINQYHCNDCDFEMARGWGGQMYVLAEVCPFCGETLKQTNDYCSGCGTLVETIDAEEFKRVVCPHPGEQQTVRAVLGDDVSEEEYESRTGFNSNCVCIDCLEQFELDIERDERRCPECGSDVVRTEQELVGDQCPKCEDGTFVETSTGMMA